MPFAFGFLIVILALLSTRVQESVRAWFTRRPVVIFAVPALLTTVFCSAAGYYGGFSVGLLALVVIYTLIPSVLAYVARANAGSGSASLLDLAAILALWLPLELGAGGSLIPRTLQGTLHAVAYGVAITLALFLFLIFRGTPEMKYSVPRRSTDWRTAALGYVVAAVVLIPLGFLVGYLNRFHGPPVLGWRLAVRILLIFAGTALPEEILFRALIQNWFIRRFASANLGIAIGAVIFGLAHLNNAPGPIPNWPYAIVATFAGAIFGTVFQRSSSIFASALVHAGVNTTKYLWF